MKTLAPVEPSKGFAPSRLPDYNQGVKDYFTGIGHALTNPKETFANDPAGTLADIASAVSGFGRSGGFSAIKEGVKAGASPVTYGMHRLPVPASVAGALAGHYTGEMAGPLELRIGEAAGAIAPMVGPAMRELHVPVLYAWLRAKEGRRYWGQHAATHRRCRT